MSQYDCDVEGHSPVYTVDRPYCKECGADLFTADLFTIEQPKFECWICKTNADYIDLLMHDEPDHCLSECVDCGQCHLCNAFDACFNEHTAVQKAFEASEEEMEATLVNLRETEVRAQQAELEIKFIDGSTGYWCKRAVEAEDEVDRLRALVEEYSTSLRAAVNDRDCDRDALVADRDEARAEVEKLKSDLDANAADARESEAVLRKSLEQMDAINAALGALALVRGALKYKEWEETPYKIGGPCPRCGRRGGLHHGDCYPEVRPASDSIPMERIEEIVEGVRPKSPLMDNFSIGKNAACSRIIAALRKETQ